MPRRLGDRSRRALGSQARCSRSTRWRSGVRRRALVGLGRVGHALAVAESKPTGSRVPGSVASPRAGGRGFEPGGLSGLRLGVAAPRAGGRGFDGRARDLGLETGRPRPLAGGFVGGGLGGLVGVGEPVGGGVGVRKLGAGAVPADPGLLPHLLGPLPARALSRVEHAGDRARRRRHHRCACPIAERLGRADDRDLARSGRKRPRPEGSNGGGRAAADASRRGHRHPRSATWFHPSGLAPGRTETGGPLPRRSAGTSPPGFPRQARAAWARRGLLRILTPLGFFPLSRRHIRVFREGLAKHFLRTAH